VFADKVLANACFLGKQPNRNRLPCPALISALRNRSISSIGWIPGTSSMTLDVVARARTSVGGCSRTWRRRRTRIVISEAAVVRHPIVNENRRVAAVGNSASAEVTCFRMGYTRRALHRTRHQLTPIYPACWLSGTRVYSCTLPHSSSDDPRCRAQGSRNHLTVHQISPIWASKEVLRISGWNADRATAACPHVALAILRTSSELQCS
jgi:hypothetical protein